MSFTSLFSSNHPKNEEIRLARRLLIKAAKEGNHTIVLRCILQGASVDSRDKHGDSVLNLASFQGHENVVNILLENGATIDKRGKDGMTALMWSAQQNHHLIVDLLLKHGANVQAQCSDGSSVLHQAAYAGSTKSIQHLITYGADKHLSLKRFLDAMNKDGSTPLLLACYAGHVEVVTCLLQHGASLHSTNQAGWTPLHGAASGGHFEVARMLIEHGANLHAKDNNGEAAWAKVTTISTSTTTNGVSNPRPHHHPSELLALLRGEKAPVVVEGRNSGREEGEEMAGGGPVGSPRVPSLARSNPSLGMHQSSSARVEKEEEEEEEDEWVPDFPVTTSVVTSVVLPSAPAVPVPAPVERDLVITTQPQREAMIPGVSPSSSSLRQASSTSRPPLNTSPTLQSTQTQTEAQLLYRYPPPPVTTTIPLPPPSSSSLPATTSSQLPVTVSSQMPVTMPKTFSSDGDDNEDWWNQALAQTTSSPPASQNLPAPSQWPPPTQPHTQPFPPPSQITTLDWWTHNMSQTNILQPNHPLQPSPNQQATQEALRDYALLTDRDEAFTWLHHSNTSHLGVRPLPPPPPRYPPYYKPSSITPSDSNLPHGNNIRPSSLTRSHQHHGTTNIPQTSISSSSMSPEQNSGTARQTSPNLLNTRSRSMSEASHTPAPSPITLGMKIDSGVRCFGDGYIRSAEHKVGHLDKAMVTRMVTLLLSEDPGQILILDPETGTSPLHQACYVGHTSCVKLMINKVCAGGLVPAGATGSLPPSTLSSPHILKHPPTLRKLSQVVDVVAKDGSSPLIIAAMGGHIEVVAYLLSIGASINHRNKAGWTALITAAATGQVEVVMYLLHEGADVHSVDLRKETALQKATQLGRWEVVRLLDRWVNENMIPINASNS